MRKLSVIALAFVLVSWLSACDAVSPTSQPAVTGETTAPEFTPTTAPSATATATPLPPTPTATPRPPTATPLPPTPTPDPAPIIAEMLAGPALRELADARGFFIGAAVEPHYIRNDTTYAETLGREFNMLTPENALKFWATHPEPDRYTFADADALVQFAEDHGMTVRGHTLLWYQGMPDWIKNATFTPEEWERVIREHITTVVGRYKGRILYWDVLNEAVADNFSATSFLRQTNWSDGLGPDFMDKAFIWAHEADPDALLFYNDYNAEGMGGKADRVYALVKGMVDRGVPIHGVGLQMHLIAGAGPRPDDVRRNIQRLNDLGLQVQITEMDIRLPARVTASQLETQADSYREYLEVCLSAENCTALVMWGFTDRYSWIPKFFTGYDHALIFDKDYVPKPAYFALRKALETGD